MRQLVRPLGRDSRRVDRAVSRAEAANARYAAALTQLQRLEMANADLSLEELHRLPALRKARREFNAAFKACRTPSWGHERGLQLLAYDMEVSERYGLPTRGLSHMWWQARCYMRGFLGL